MSQRTTKEEAAEEPRAVEDATGDERAESDEGTSDEGTVELEDDRDATPDELRQQRDEYKARWQRAQADYKNARRRGLSDQEASVRRSLQPILDDCLLVLDHLDMALSCPANEEETRTLAQGVQLTRDQLVAALERHGVVAIPEGGTFDPALHQAMETLEDPSVEPGTIVATIRRGFRWGDIVLRFAQVRVAAAADDSESED